MCNLYRMTSTRAEVAQLFDLADDARGANFAEEIYPGYPGLVAAEGRLRVMNWGFPLALRGRQGQLLKPRPVNNTRSDKLGSPFWRDSFERRRCLIPVSAWAEAEGPKGQMTRSWLSMPDRQPFACAGIWRMSAEWGEVYSLVMTDAAGLAAEVHTRMPVILAPEDHGKWTDADAEAARALCRPWQGELVLDRTKQPWAGGLAALRDLL